MLIKQSKVIQFIPTQFQNFQQQHLALSQLPSFDQLQFNKESEISLQEKIIQLYNKILTKTIDNIELKKTNEIIQGQIQAYHEIVEKIGITQSVCKKIQAFDISMEEKRKSIEDFDKNDCYEIKLQIHKDIPEDQNKNQKKNDYFQSQNLRSYVTQNLRYKNQRTSCLEVFGKVQNIEKTQRQNINMHRKRRSCGEDQFQFPFSPRIEVQNKSKTLKTTQNLRQEDRQNYCTKSMKKYSSIDIESLWNNAKPSFGQAGLRSKNEVNEKGRAKESFELIKSSSKLMNAKLKLKR